MTSSWQRPWTVRLKLGGRRMTINLGRRGRPRNVGDDPRVARLLSRGWREVGVETSNGWSRPGRPSPQEDIDDVRPSSALSSSDSHGGDEATGDVADSPNASPDGLNPSGASIEGAEHDAELEQPESAVPESEEPDAKTSRRPRGRRSSRRSSTPPPAPADQDAGTRLGGRGGWVPALPSLNADATRAARRAGKLLAQLAGSAAQRTPVGVTVDPVRLAIALEVGDDPMPALEAPRERPKARVLVTNDESWSTQAWSHVGRAFADCVARLPDVAASCLPNFNGRLVARHGEDIPNEEADRLVAAHDVVVYLGDEDGERAWDHWASLGVTVVALDTFRATWEDPRLASKRSNRSGGRVIRIDQVSAKSPDTWPKALRLALREAQ